MIIQLPNGNSIDVPDSAPPQTKLDYYRLCLDMINDAISVINQNAANDETNISNLQSGLTTADNNIAALTKQAANLQSDINTINGEIKDINNNIGMGGNANFTNLAGGSKMIWLRQPLLETGLSALGNRHNYFSYPVTLPSPLSTIYHLSGKCFLTMKGFCDSFQTLQDGSQGLNNFTYVGINGANVNPITLTTDIVNNNCSLAPIFNGKTNYTMQCFLNASLSGGNLVFNVDFYNTQTTSDNTACGIMIKDLLLIGA